MSANTVIAIEYQRDLTSRLSKVASLPGFALLDSCTDRCDGGRYDIVTANPRVTLTTVGDQTRIERRGQVESSSDDPFSLLKRELARYAPEKSIAPFGGGAVGYFAYDLGRRIESLPETSKRDIDVPDMSVGVYDWAAVFDHTRQAAWLVAQPDSAEDLGYWSKVFAAAPPVTPAAYATSFSVTSPVRPEMSYEEYAACFERIKRYIIDGDCYQVNLAQRFSAGCSGSSWDAYRRLRGLNPAPFSAFITTPNGAVLSSSPERFLRVDDGAVETKPIKGTRPRSPDPDEDQVLAKELSESIKDRAENVMIVDLLRNDLGKTCEVGSVITPELFEIESFATVHHLVSTVKGRLAKGVSPIDLLRGCFPGGSITGAPKHRAMEIIEELEPCRRTVYCGSIGYVSFDGTMDSNIAIRTLVHHNDRIYCWAGGGIVADSEVRSEFDECHDKAAAMLNVLTDAEVQYLRR